MQSEKLINLFPVGDIYMPPSKSVGHRAVICAGLAAVCGGGQSLLQNVGCSDDINASIACMQALGAVFTRQGQDVLVSGTGYFNGEEGAYSFGGQAASSSACGNGHVAKPVQHAAAGAPSGGAGCKGGSPAAPLLPCGESGSTLRFLLPVAAQLVPNASFTGSRRLLQRPLGIYKNIFTSSGMRFAQGENGVQIQGRLKAGEYAVQGNVSSQFVSGLLLALPLAEGNSIVNIIGTLESADYVNITVDVMKHFGVSVTCQNGSYHIKGRQAYSAANYKVEGDYSQAAFFLAAAALGQPLRCAGLQQGSRQGDARVIDVLRQMGAGLHFTNGFLVLEPPKDGLRAVTVNVGDIPDLVPPLAALCCFCRGNSHIVNAGRLRIKESDRLHALYSEFTKLGAHIQQGEDSLSITGQKSLKGGRVHAHGDHRIAMAMAVAALGCAGPVHLAGWQHVNKSYPHFWQDFEKEAQGGGCMG